MIGEPPRTGPPAGSAAYSLSQGGTRKFDVHLGKNADALLAELEMHRLDLQLVVTVRGGKTISRTFL